MVITIIYKTKYLDLIYNTAYKILRKKDIDTLERIQRRATQFIPELRYLSYKEHLKECGLTTLETRRLRGDQIEVFKILIEICFFTQDR